MRVNTLSVKENILLAPENLALAKENILLAPENYVQAKVIILSPEGTKNLGLFAQSDSSISPKDSFEERPLYFYNPAVHGFNRGDKRIKQLKFFCVLQNLFKQFIKYIEVFLHIKMMFFTNLNFGF